jgi:hypothetical protein
MQRSGMNSRRAAEVAEFIEASTAGPWFDSRSLSAQQSKGRAQQSKGHSFVKSCVLITTKLICRQHAVLIMMDWLLD